MISRALRLEAFDRRNYGRLLQLLDPPGDDGAAERGWLDRVTGGSTEQGTLPPRGAPAALVLLRAGRPRRILLLGGGELPLSALSGTDGAALSRLRKEQGLAFAVALASDALPELTAEIQRQLRPQDDLVAQGLTALRVLQRALGKDVVVSPRLLGALPLPPYDLLQRTFDRIFPAGRSLLFYVFDGARVYSSVIVRKRGADVDLVSSQRAFDAELRVRGLADLPRLRKLVAERYGEVHICLGVPLSAWRRFVAGDRSALARALASRQAVLDPAPAWLRALIGAGAVSEAATRSARFAGKLLSRSPLGNLLGDKPEKLVGKIGNPLEALGIDPFEFLRWGRSWSRRSLGLLSSFDER